MWFQWLRQLNTEVDSRRNEDFLQSAALDKIQQYFFSQSPVFTRTYKSHSANKNPVASASLKLSHISMMQIFPIRKFKQTSQESRTVLENYSLFIYKKPHSVLVAANFIKWEHLLSNTSRAHREFKRRGRRVQDKGGTKEEFSFVFVRRLFLCFVQLSWLSPSQLIPTNKWAKRMNNVRRNARCIKGKFVYLFLVQLQMQITSVIQNWSKLLSK